MNASRFHVFSTWNVECVRWRRGMGGPFFPIQLRPGSGLLTLSADRAPFPSARIDRKRPIKFFPQGNVKQDVPGWRVSHKIFGPVIHWQNSSKFTGFQGFILFLISISGKSRSLRCNEGLRKKNSGPGGKNRTKIRPCGATLHFPGKVNF